MYRNRRLFLSGCGWGWLTWSAKRVPPDKGQTLPVMAMLNSTTSEMIGSER